MGAPPRGGWTCWRSTAGQRFTSFSDRRRLGLCAPAGREAWSPDRKRARLRHIPRCASSHDGGVSIMALTPQYWRTNSVMPCRRNDASYLSGQTHTYPRRTILLPEATTTSSGATGPRSTRRARPPGTVRSGLDSGCRGGSPALRGSRDRGSGRAPNRCPRLRRFPAHLRRPRCA